MNTAASFSEAELRAIRRTFLTRKATPEEIRLVLRPKQRSWQMVRMGFVVPLLMGFPVWMVAREVFKDVEQIKGLAVADFWAGLCLLALLHVLIFGLLPAVYVARFELILRPGKLYVEMSGLGFEQRRHAGCCAIVNRRLWCDFTVDSVPYELLRRWWQLPLPMGKGAAAIAQMLKTANLALHDSLEAGGSRSAILDTSRRKLLAQAFGEAITTDNEVVLLLPPATSWLLVGGLLGGALGATVAGIWDAYHGLWVGQYVSGPQVVLWNLRAMPIWLPTLAAYFLTAVPCLLADPWVRRALAVVPRGQRLLQIWKGGRARGEYPWEENHIYIADWRNHETLASQLYVKTRAWSGWKPAQHHFEEYTMAMYALDAWAMGKPVPWENEDG
jgi:hypothetical protein